MAFNIGVNVLEVDGKAAPTLAAAPTSIAGFLVRSERGIPDRAIAIRGFGDFVANFGSFIDNAHGAHAVRGFFDNGGSEGYAVRIVGAGAVVAAQTLNDRGGLATLQVFAGMLGRQDPGAWGNALRVTVADHPRGTTPIPAQIVGTTAEPFALVAGQTFVVSVNGAAAVTVTFSAADFVNIATAAAAEVAAVIRREVPTLRAGVTPAQQLAIASANPGPASRVVVTAGPAATTLGFAGGTLDSAGGLAAGSSLAMLHSTGGLRAGTAARFETRGHIIAPAAMGAALSGTPITVTPDAGAPVTINFAASDFVGGLGAITAGEVVAAINRQAAGFQAALNDTARLVLLSNSFGPASSIAVAGAAADLTALGLTGAVPAPGLRAHKALTFVSEAYKFAQWPAAPALPAIPTNAARIESAEFDLVVSRNGNEVERFESLSMQNALEYYAPSVINDSAAGSRFITVVDLASVSIPGVDVPAVVTLSPMTTVGVDGAAPADAAYLGNPVTRTGLFALDMVSIQLLACPETTSGAVVAGALSYCENRGDMMFVGTAPDGYGLADIKTYANPFRARKVFGALYAPWISVANPRDTTGANPLIRVPPVGHVMGVFARIAEARGIWKAPAGDEALLRNALGVDFDMTDTDHTDLVKNGSVNGIRAIPGAGIIIDSSRTLSTDSRWLFVNVRRLFNFVKATLRDGLRFVAQEPHDENLRRSVKFNVVTPFLLGLWRQGAFGSDPADQVFTVICDATNNPPAEVNLGNFKIEVYFYPVKPAETIVIVVGQQESGAAAAEA